MSVAALLLALAIPLHSFAAPPVVALHRTEIVGEQPERGEVLHALVAAELIRRGASLAPSEAVQSFLSSRDGSCLPLPDDQRTACLVELAKAVDANRTLIVTVAPYVPKKIILSATLVDQKGEMLQSIPAAEFPRKADVPVERALEVALAEFIPRLNVFEDLTLQLEPLAGTEDPTGSQTSPASANAVAPTITEPVRPAGSSRTLAWTSLGVGAVLAGAGTFGIFHGNSQVAEFESAYADGRRPALTERDRLAGLLDSGQRSRLLGGVGVGLGAAAVGAGLYFLFTGNDDAPSSSNTQVLISPTSVGVSLAFH